MRLRNALVGAVLLGGCDKNPCCEPPVSSHLAFIVQPSMAAGGTSITPAVQVAAQDLENNTVTAFDGVVTLALGADPVGGTLSGTMAVQAVNGVATFSALRIDKTGTGYTLTATATGLTGATSAAFDIAVGPAARLAFKVEPSNTYAGTTIAPAVQVTAQDAGGNTAAAFTGNVTIAIGTNPVGGTLSGTTTAPAVGGVATFSDLSIEKAGSGYALTAAAGSLTGAVSTPFTIANAVSPAYLHITTTTTGAAIPTGYRLCVDNYSSGCGWSGTIGANSAVTVPVAAGSHDVGLYPVPANCGVGGHNPRTVTASGTTQVPFTVFCLDTASVHVAIATTRFGVAQIVWMSATGGSVTRIGAGLLGSEPTWSSDGSQLAFVRPDQFDRDNLLAAHTDGSNAVTIVAGDEPAWRPHR